MRVDAELVDNDGAAHRPSASSSRFGFGGSYSSGSACSSSGGSSTIIRCDQTGSSTRELKYAWTLVSGRPDHLVVRVVERQPGSRRVLSKLSDIPLDGSAAR